MTYKLEMSLICIDEQGKEKKFGIAANVNDCGCNTPEFIKLHNGFMLEALIRRAEKEKQFRDCWPLTEEKI